MLEFWKLIVKQASDLNNQMLEEWKVVLCTHIRVANFTCPIAMLSRTHFGFKYELTSTIKVKCLSFKPTLESLSLSLSKEGIPFTSTIKKSLHLSHVVEKAFTFIMTRIPFLSLSMFLHLFLAWTKGQSWYSWYLWWVLLFILSVFYPHQNKVRQAFGTCGVDALRKDNVCQSQT